MRNSISWIILVLLLFTSCGKEKQKRHFMDLSGSWGFYLDSLGDGEQKSIWLEKITESVTLPGTTDSNKKGIENKNQGETTHLSRKYTYEGVAWYKREVVIPKGWAKKHIVLCLERTRPSAVWVNDVLVDSCNYLSTPHEYDLSGYLTPGKHSITIRVDNGGRIPGQIRGSSHSCTESTQTNWNGIIGRIELQAMNPLFIESVKTFPDVISKAVRIKLTLSRGEQLAGQRIVFSADATNSIKLHKVKPVTLGLSEGVRDYELTYPMGDNVMLWSEFDPVLYNLKTEISGVDEYIVTFGMRDFKPAGMHMTINGTEIFLRGKHDAAVFPLTAYTAMDLKEWQRYFRICRDYGLNHVRFHSWCPPAACFEAADLEGIYLQPELPIWGSFREEPASLMDFLMEDGEQIMEEYSNHPSFVMFALGNELGGDIEVMKRFINRYREIEPRHLYTYGSNIFLGTRGHVPGEDFLVTCRMGSGEGYSTHARASFSFADAEQGGYLNNTYPNLSMDFDEALSASPVPVIGHETGQFQVYPNYREMEKYTGVLEPRNFRIFKDRLDKAGMLDQAEDFFNASGAWSVELYRADIEMNLRSKKMGGFQLLDLQDYPGQGSAYVGILDAFMDSKGLIEPAEWRHFCSEVVPLLVVDGYTWQGGQRFTGKVKLAQYGSKKLDGSKLSWSVAKDNGDIFAQGNMVIPPGSGLLELGGLDFEIPETGKAFKGKFSLRIEGTEYENHYPLWVYPGKQEQDRGEVMVARELGNDVLAKLKRGGRVLLIPEKEKNKDVTIDGLFQTDYWNYRMFKTICERMGKTPSPGTLGILTNPEHAVFNDFPTEFHTNWQWYPIVKNSYPLILDRMPKGYHPVIQAIDNIERNHRLGLLFELNVEGGKLMVCMADLDAAAAKPEGRQFYSSLYNYMNSDKFNPTHKITYESLKSLFEPGLTNEGIRELHNISYD